mmetsp:Transcript_3528/g.10972  ORF Transcript_3528/g.10972 Transcript_3528/m.10972 type:complete len:293 (-) Transcript_3528:294-1172(-)
MENHAGLRSDQPRLLGDPHRRVREDARLHRPCRHHRQGHPFHHPRRQLQQGPAGAVRPLRAAELDRADGAHPVVRDVGRRPRHPGVVGGDDNEQQRQWNYPGHHAVRRAARQRDGVRSLEQPRRVGDGTRPCCARSHRRGRACGTANAALVRRLRRACHRPLHGLGRRDGNAPSPSPAARRLRCGCHLVAAAGFRRRPTDTALAVVGRLARAWRRDGVPVARAEIDDGGPASRPRRCRCHTRSVERVRRDELSVARCSAAVFQQLRGLTAGVRQQPAAACVRQPFDERRRPG